MEQLTIILPALIAGVLVLTTHVPLGRQVLKRGIIFIDLAVAQAAATGALIAMLFFGQGGHSDLEHSWDHGITIQLAAGLFALAMALLLHQLEKHFAHIQEALIGGSFVLLASLAVLLGSKSSQGSEHIHDLLAGQILWVDNHQLIILFGINVIVLACQALFKNPLANFYLPFALAITASVQAIGVYLVFASLIFPALACYGANNSKGNLKAFCVGISGYIVGLLASVMFDLPSGPAVVAALALICFPMSLLSAKNSTKTSA